MKRRCLITIALIFILTFSMILVGCSKKKEDDPVGTWKVNSLTMNGVEMNLSEENIDVNNIKYTINKDGSLIINLYDEEFKTTWENVDNKVVLYGFEGVKIEFTFNNEKLVSSEIKDDFGNVGIMILEREK